MLQNNLQTRNGCTCRLRGACSYKSDLLPSKRRRGEDLRESALKLTNMQANLQTQVPQILFGIKPLTLGYFFRYGYFAAFNNSFLTLAMTFPLPQQNYQYNGHSSNNVIHRNAQLARGTLEATFAYVWLEHDWKIGIFTRQFL